MSRPSAPRLVSAPSSAERSSGPQVMPIRRALAPLNVPARKIPAAVSIACARILMWPSSMPAMASRAASLASAWTSDAPPSAFGSRIASGLAGTMASRSASVRPVAMPLTRTSRRGRFACVTAFLMNAAALARAASLRSIAIESSRSTIMASAPLANALSSLEPPSAGTNSKERMIIRPRSFLR